MATLTARGRKRIPRSKFALPKARKYPVHDLRHARNALARVMQSGTPTERRRVKAAVKRRYPALARRSSVIATKRGPGLRIRRRAKKRRR
jgi:hypothetical protein